MATVTGAVSTVSINGNSFYEFTGSGTITYASSRTVPVLIVAGGGGGGGSARGGEGGAGGGGGGVGVGSLSFNAIVTYNITVGNGGSAGLGGTSDAAVVAALNGDNSSIIGGTINETAYGGGAGGSSSGIVEKGSGQNGGSGGGADGGWTYATAIGNATRGSGSLTYNGSNGGQGYHGGGSGGGGGASAAGGNANVYNGGLGGGGYTWSTTGNAYGGGGGGGSAGSGYGTGTGGTGGTGGGGTGGGTSSPTAISGTANRGGGGGGAYGGTASVVRNGAAGGSGVVYIQIVGTVGSAPTITRITTDNLSSISVFFTPGTGGSPDPTTYYYSLDGGSTYTNANSTTSPIIISGLIRDSPYNIALIATNIAGNTAASNIVPITITYPCFKQGTRILAFIKGREQYVPVETLKRGDLVKTSKSGYKSISLIGKKTIHNSPDSNIKNRLFRYSQHICPELIEDLCITGEHCALVNVVSDEKLQEIKDHMGQIYTTEGDYRVPAHLDSRAKPYEKEGLYTIWHFALENESPHANYGVYANGLLVESASEEYLQDYSGMNMIG